MAETKQFRQPLELLRPRSLKYLSGYLQNIVSGRLWLKVLMDRWVGGPKSKKAEAAAEREREKLRAETGADVVVQKP